MDQIEELVNELEKKIRQLKVEYDIFIVGGKNVPPVHLKNSVDSLIQRLLDTKGFSYAQKFKYNTLIARYYAYKEVWRKKIQDKEEKGVLREEKELKELQAPTPEAIAKRDQNQYVFVTDDPAKNVDMVKEFYTYMQHTHERVGQQSFEMDFDKFFHFLEVKTTQLKQKYKCDAVEFRARVDSAEKKVKFSAKIKQK